jgi:hypothetical protein
MYLVCWGKIALFVREYNFDAAILGSSFCRGIGGYRIILAIADYL